MSVFQYRAIQGDENETKGIVDAPDKAAAAAKLRSEGMVVFDLVPVSNRRAYSRDGTQSRSGKKGLFPFGSIRPVTQWDIARFFEQTALMLRTGMSLLEALQLFKEQCTKPRLASAVGRIAESVRSGDPLSQGLLKEKKYIPVFAVRMIETAEATGELDTILDRIKIHITRVLEFRRTLATSLIYPAIVVLTAIGVTIFLVTAVIPKFLTFLSRRQIELPWSTQLLVDVSTFISGALFPSLVGAVVIAFAAYVFYRTSRGRYVMDYMLFKIPVLGSLFMFSTLAYFGRTLATLLRSGVTLLAGLRILKDGVWNRPISQAIGQTADEVLKGRSFSESLENSPLPTTVVQIIAVGERPGELDRVLEEMGQYYDTTLQERFKRLHALFEPAMIVTIGLLVGFVYYSFFQVVLSTVQR